MTERLGYAHPLTGLIGQQARDLLTNPSWLTELQSIAARAVLWPAALALLLWAVLTMAVPARGRPAILALTCCVLIASLTRDKNHSIMPDLIADRGGWPALALIVAWTSLSWLVLRFRAISTTAPVARVVRWLTEKPHAPAIAAGSLYALSVLSPSEGNFLLQPAAFIALLIVLVPAVQQSGRPDPLLWASLIGLLAVAVTSDQFWYLRPIGPMRSLVHLLFVAFMALAAFRPKNALLWFMPSMAVFHVALAAQLALVVVVIEVVLSLVRRRSSLLLVSSSITFALAYLGVVFGVDSPFLSPQTAEFFAVVHMVANWPGILPAGMCMLAVLALSTVVVRRGDEVLGRSALMIAAGLAIAFLSIALLDQDPSLENAPGFALFTKSVHYLTAPLFGAGILGVLLALFGPGERIDAAGERAKGVSIPMLCGLLLLMVAAKADLRPRDVLSSAWTSGSYLVAGQLNAGWCRDLWQVRPDDETYVLSTTEPVSASVNYLSALKLRLRLEAGLYRADDFRIEPQRPDRSRCKDR
jgi:hypothetical protein